MCRSPKQEREGYRTKACHNKYENKGTKKRIKCKGEINAHFLFGCVNYMPMKIVGTVLSRTTHRFIEGRIKEQWSILLEN